MGKKSSAARAKKVKQKHLASFANRPRRFSDPVLGEGDSVLASLIDVAGAELIRIESFGGECVVFVAGEPTVGSSEPEVALGILLFAAADDQHDGNESVLVLGEYYRSEIESACEKQSITVDAYLQSLLPEDRRHLRLPATTTLT